MFFDQFSLLAAIGFSSAALCVTLFGAWMGARDDRFLLSWSSGLSAIVLGVILFGALGSNYRPLVQMASFTALIAGCGMLYAGAMQFRAQKADWRKVAGVTAGGIGVTGAAFAFGYSGLGTTLGNFTIGTLLGLIALQYWTGRRELPLAMRANAILYLLSAVSFVLCALVLLMEGQWVLTARPSNWAEDLNSIIVIICLTGIGALSLTLNQSRMARLHRMEALTDPLTGLLNRRGLMERYRYADFGRTTATIVFDLDHFKDINDRYGHAAGDVVLRRFAAIVLANIRASDMAARIGGEEFCVVLQNTGHSAVWTIADRIRAELQDQGILVPQGKVLATVSGGIAVARDERLRLEALMREADAALYVAKSSGRNRVFKNDTDLVFGCTRPSGLDTRLLTTAS